MKKDAIVGLLPNIFQQTYEEPPNVLGSYLALMEWFHADTEEVLQNIDTYFDADRAPDDFVPFLAHWVNMADLLDENGTFPTGLPRLRDLILNAIHLAHWRGTQMGLIEFLQIATKLTDFEVLGPVQFLQRVDTTGTILLEKSETERLNAGENALSVFALETHSFHVIILCPALARAHEPLVRKIIEREKPVYVTYSLRWKQQI